MGSGLPLRVKGTSVTVGRPVRVTHVLAPVAFGGGEALLSNLMAAKRPDLLESMITLGRASKLKEILEASGTDCRMLGRQEVQSQRKGQAYELIAAVPKLPALRSALADLRPDIVHTHGFPPSLLGALPLRRGTRRVYTHHYERKPPGVVERRCLTLMFDRYDVLTTVADHLSASMNGSFPDLRQPFETLRIAVRDDFFDPAPSGVLRERFAAGTVIGVCVGRLVATKNQRLIVEALAASEPEVRANIGIALVGSGPDEGDLQQRAAQLGVGDRVAFLGQIEAGTMPSLLADADFGIFPTVTEASSVAAAEALAAGLPLLTLDIPSMRETAGDAGIYVSPERFANALAEMARTFAALVPAARSAAERFRMATVRDQWAAMYHRVSIGR